MLMQLLDRLFGIKIDIISPEEAARIMLEREVTFKWQPQIVEIRATTPQPAAAISAVESGT
jgi:hypothetical protein